MYFAFLPLLFTVYDTHQFKTAEGALRVQRDGTVTLSVPMAKPDDYKPVPDRNYVLLFESPRVRLKALALDGKRATVDGRPDVKNGDLVFYVDAIYEVKVEPPPDMER
jgi:hypothetical protein